MDAPRTTSRTLTGGGLIVTVPVGAEFEGMVYAGHDSHHRAILLLREPVFGSNESRESLLERYHDQRDVERAEKAQRLTNSPEGG